MRIRHLTVFVVACLASAVSTSAQNPAPETVLVTYHAKPGSEAALAGAIAKQWATATRLKLVLETPHTLVRGDEKGKTYFVEIFTWRDANIPDHAPAAIQSIWSQMNQLVEARGSQPGIDFAAVSVEK